MKERVRLIALIVGVSACAPAPPRNVADSLPQVKAEPLPFRYPLELYEKGVEGDVTLRLRIDTAGGVVAESVSVAETSGNAKLDAAALEGAPALLFRPAKLGGRAVPLTVLFPVRFRVPPGGSRQPADTHGTVPGR